MISLMRDSVTILRATTVTDRYGNSVPGTVTETVVTGCAVVPPGARLSSTGGAEIVDARDQVESTMVLLAPLGTEILATDQVRYDGQVWDVNGQPERFTLTSLAHVAARLKVVTG